MKKNNRSVLLNQIPLTAQRFLSLLLGIDLIQGRFIKQYHLRIFCAECMDGILSEMFNYGNCLYALYVKKKIQETYR